MTSMAILGFHHITLVCQNARRTADFYTRALGLRLVKKTVNFDDPGSYHLYFGDNAGSPGTLVTFFEWPGAPQGRVGIGGTHHMAFTVDTPEAQLKWTRWLNAHGVGVGGPYDRKWFSSIYFRDPDGVILEIATAGPGWTVDEPLVQLGTSVQLPPESATPEGRDEMEIRKRTWPDEITAISPDMAIRGLHHITAMGTDIERLTGFYTQVLGLRLLKRSVNFDDPSVPHYHFGDHEGRPGTILTYFSWPPGAFPRAAMGAGLTHHIAFAVADDDEQARWRERLLKFGLSVSPVKDRNYFHSIYFRDPEGHLLEIATNPPGFAVDEPVEQLGENLKGRRWLDGERHQ